MPYSYLDHTADVGISACGSSLKEAFSSGAEALLNLVYELPAIDKRASVDIEAEAPSFELLFVEVLNELIGLLDTKGLAIRSLEATEIVEVAGIVSFTGKAMGEPFDPEKHPVKTEVKAATYSGLRLTEAADRTTIQCLLDI